MLWVNIQTSWSCSQHSPVYVMHLYKHYYQISKHVEEATARKVFSGLSSSKLAGHLCQYMILVCRDVGTKHNPVIVVMLVCVQCVGRMWSWRYWLWTVSHRYCNVAKTSIWWQQSWEPQCACTCIVEVTCNKLVQAVYHISDSCKLAVLSCTLQLSLLFDSSEYNYKVKVKSLWLTNWALCLEGILRTGYIDLGTN